MAADTAGGTLRFSALGGNGSAIDPRNIYSVLAYHSMASAFDFLALQGEDGLELGVARSMTPNEDATKWTIQLRDDVRFHDGKQLTCARCGVLGPVSWATGKTSPYFAGTVGGCGLREHDRNRRPDAGVAAVATTRRLTSTPR